MYSAETKIRVRYGETDQMGYAYYGYYAFYYEEARTSLIRSLGISYKEMEEAGVLLPVIDLSIKYIAPAYYDELITIKTFIQKLPNVRIEFDYEVYNESSKVINTGSTTLVFVNKLTGKPQRAPENLMRALNGFFGL